MWLSFVSYYNTNNWKRSLEGKQNLLLLLVLNPGKSSKQQSDKEHFIRQVVTLKFKRLNVGFWYTPPRGYEPLTPGFGALPSCYQFA
jgi:hypothetical protein